ncbi:MAG: NTP transferase domain-containing protein, partial [bacterium]
MVEQEGPQPGNNSGVTAIVLAAGKSTRMRSKIPKGLHLLWGRPLLAHILEALAQADVTRRIVVVGHQADAVRTTLDARYGNGVLEYAEQLEQKGTGHAAQMT